MKLTNIEIKNFRGIKHTTVFFPSESRIVCLIGAGDSGKSTLLKSIEWVLWPSWSLIATDMDFYNCNTDEPIEITASITELPEALMKEDKYGLYLRDFTSIFSGGDDEPKDNGIIVLTIRLTIDDTLEPKWEVITDRTEPKPIGQKDRRLLSFGVVGFDHDKDFKWGRDSILQKYCDSRDALHNAFTQAMRSAVENTNLEALDEASPKISEIGEKYGVAFNGELHNKLIMQNGSYSTTVGVFDDMVPFSQRGLGSKRLLSIGMNVSAYTNGTLILVDEIETGLEPYRISALINQFRDQFKACGQLIMTTHSRSVVCECTVDELAVVNTINGELYVNYLNPADGIKSDMQGIVRQEPDAFLCKRIIVCEGKTEIGVLRAFDNYLYETLGVRFAHFGVGMAYGGGGDKFFTISKLFEKCGYDVCIFMDSDLSFEEDGKTEARRQGIPVFSWDAGLSIEEQIFHDFSINTAENLIAYACEEKTFDHVIGRLNQRFNDDDKPYFIQNGEIKLKDEARMDQLTAIGTIAKDKKNEWFKRINRGQRIGEIIFSDYAELGEDTSFKKTMSALQKWVISHET